MSTLRDEFYQQADRFFLGVTSALFGVSLLLANWYNTWTEALVIGLPAVLVPYLVSKLSPGSRLSRIAYAAALMILTGLHIHQAHGLLEMHFGIFALLALLLYYRDSLPILVAAGVIAVHHLLFNYLQEQGSNVWVFESRTGIDIVLLHAVFVVLEAAALVYLARKSWQEFQQNMELAEIGQHISREGEVDLTFRIQNPEGPFTRSFNVFFALMEQLVREANQMSARLQELSETFRTSTQAMNDGAQRQFHETDMIATATEEMNASMQTMQKHVNEAAQQTEQAETLSRRSGDSMEHSSRDIQQLAGDIERASEVIHRLHEESNNIGSVLAVIRGIAEQTNLLALNAAIEAARAGEQGRGFAVVADEVRTLASRTQNSTAEIQRMIERLQAGSTEAVNAMSASREGAEKSVQQIHSSSADMQQMATAMAEIYAMSHQLAHAMDEQSSAIAEVTGNLAVIRDISEQTSGQSAAAATDSQRLSTMATDLRRLLKQFHVSS